MPYIWHLAPLDQVYSAVQWALPGGEGLSLAKSVHKVYEYGDSQTLNTEDTYSRLQLSERNKEK